MNDTIPFSTFELSATERLNTLPTGTAYTSRAFLVDGKEVGEVYMSSTHYYLGRLYAEAGPSVIAAYTTQETLTPESAARRLTRAVLVQAAHRHGIRLTTQDITIDEGLYPEIDSMPAGEWLDAMTMD